MAGLSGAGRAGGAMNGPARGWRPRHRAARRWGVSHLALVLALTLGPALPALPAYAAPRKVAAKAPRAGGGGGAQIGLASWYGPGFHGKKTASGKPFNQHALTAAHPHLPLGSRVQVTKLANGKTVAVTINDRGPRRRGRIIDLSRAAARHLAMEGTGVARVKVAALAAPRPATP